MRTWESGNRPITIAILAMGGEGGGVLADWIVAVGEAAGFHSQNTSVAGVAQRTGATVYYAELFPPDSNVEAGGRNAPILSLFPTPGQVDIVIASELMESGRAVQRGFSTPDRTTLITSTNRVYSITEKIALGDGRVDDEALLGIARSGSQRLIAADFAALASASGSVISASLFGALAGSGSLPFTRADFENAIRASGKGVDASLRAFAAGFDAATDAQVARAPRPDPVPITIGRRPAEIETELDAERKRAQIASTAPGTLVGPGLQSQAQRILGFPRPARPMLVHGIVRTAVYQSADYADQYLVRASKLAAADSARDDGARLTTEGARYLALWMCYQDIVHVALQKTRRERMAKVRAEAHAAPEDLMNVREYLHPQLEEIADSMPKGIGRWLSTNRFVGRGISAVTRRGIVVNTTSIIGFTMLRIVSALRPLRPRSLRYWREQAAIDAWIELALETAPSDYDLACEIIECQRVLKGYGETQSHGRDSFQVLMAAARELRGSGDAGAKLARLRAAALADESGEALRSMAASA